MDDIIGHYERKDGGEQAFFLVKLNMHTDKAKELHSCIVREVLAVALEQQQSLSEDIDFTVEIARYYDKNGD
jgi:hypothetical protein